MVRQKTPITPAQLKKLHCVLSSLGMMEYKKELLLKYTSGRTDSARELSKAEAIDLIGQLSANDPRERHIKIVWALAHQAGIIYGDGPDDPRINAAKLDQFLKERGTVKKGLRSMSLAEVKKVHRQFEAIVRNNQRSSENKAAKAATDALLAELNITVK